MSSRFSTCIRLMVLMLVVFVAIAPIPAEGAPQQVGAIRSPWDVVLFDNHLSVYFDGYLSSTFFGPYQIPFFLGYSSPGYINFAIKSETGSCGPGDEWYCNSIDIRTYPAADEDISPVATHIWGPDTTSWGIAYEYVNLAGDSYLVVMSIEHENDFFPYVGSSLYFLYNFEDTYTIVGPPALAYDLGGHPAVAFIRRTEASLFTSLIYAHYDPDPTNPCVGSTDYQCDTIDSSTLAGIDGPVGLAFTETGQPRISYFKDTVLSEPALMYAYPQSNILYHPNCGPDDTWRCVLISNSIDGDSDIDMAIGGGSTRPQLAWTHHGADTLNQLVLYHARYVGQVAAANCGMDYAFTGSGLEEVNLWDCSLADYMSTNGETVTYQNVSIQVDNDNNPVMAYNTGDTYFSLGVLYGNSDGSYDYQRVDSPNAGISTGKNPQLALDKNGRGFLAFTDDDSPVRFKIAMQDFRVLLPAVLK